MAYLKPEDDEEQGGGQGQLYATQGQSAEAGAGSGAPSAGGTGSAPASTAGRAGGFSNVMDFLKANRGNQALQSQIRGAGENVLSGARTAGQEAIGQAQEQIGQVKAQTLSGFDDPNKVKSALTQQFQAPDVAGAFEGTQQGARQKLSELKSGSLQGLGSLYSPKAESPLYRPGMRAMDESLLQQDQEFMSQYVPQLQQRYQSEVADPLSKQAMSVQGEAAKRAEEVAQARTASASKLQDFLRGQTSAVDAELERQNALSPERVGMTEIDPSSGSSVDYRSSLEKQLQEAGLDPAKFARTQAGTVSRETAAEAALGKDKIAQYNALAQMLSETGGPSLEQLSGGKKFVAGQNIFDVGRAEEALRGVSQEKYRQNQAENIATQTAQAAKQARESSISGSKTATISRTNDALRSFYATQAQRITSAQADVDKARASGDRGGEAIAQQKLAAAKGMQPPKQLQAAARENLGQDRINSISAEVSKKYGMPLAWGVSYAPPVPTGGGSGSGSGSKKSNTIKLGVV